eukprot:TRINITY_DN3746_c0_g1_i1.p1 TRINITY_DN3746_c0_g1~~TRINITY_DN3746_c0_g1_i1.p1  ORF type:complete len:469 (-),score=132.26 TRINITY_DN3746_c0_g1_i1:129-1535(-)
MFANVSPARQKLLIRLSIVLNLFLLLYLSLSAGWNITSDTSAPSLPYSRDILNQYFEKSTPTQESLSEIKAPTSNLQSLASSSKSPSQSLQASPPFSISNSVQCFNKPTNFSQSMRGNYWVLYNYIRAGKQFNCNQTITYTTHGDFTFLDNLEPLLDRWRGPISVAVYAPGSDLEDSIDAILYYRDCTNSSLVRDLATFHIYFDLSHIPAQVPRQDSLLHKRPNCLLPEGLTNTITYKKRMGLVYPVNVARNVARVTASTHFIFPSDIELYPSPNLIPEFLAMIRRNEKKLPKNQPRVFVNSIFEIAANHSLPNTKSELIHLMESSTVIPFHKHVCPQCHKIPHSKEWLEAKVKPGLNVLHVGKRIKPFQHWEPIYIGTHQEPLYDERLSWEGRSDKMAQGFKLCLSNYQFHILDNAFLIHRPGIKTKKTLHSAINRKKIEAQNALLKKTIFPEIKKLFGVRKGCEMF